MLIDTKSNLRTRIDYINNLKKTDSSVIISLIYALSPQEACEFFDLTFEQDFHTRRYILRKIYADIEREYLPIHKLLINRLIKKLDEKNFLRKQSCAYSIDFLYDGLPSDEKRRIFKKLLFSKSSRNRDRILKRIKDNWDRKHLKVLEQIWLIYKDPYTLDIILKHFPAEYVRANYKDLLQYSMPYQKSKLFIRLGGIDFNFVQELKAIDEISFAYVLTKFDKKLTLIEAKSILKNNHKDERIGLLLWCYGQMGLWDIIVEYQDHYKDRLQSEY